uniref:PG_binding_1 domain-containing protein n=1 Tax=Syphacia muris TaxID=451379 RepID=A0A0N5AP69_9BILA
MSYNANTVKVHYLEQFNYLPKQTGVSAMLSSEVVEEALKKLQRYGGIPVTGKLDSATMRLMQRKRCGLGDQQQSHRHRRHRKRYLGNGSIWHKRLITYRTD